MAQIQLPFTIDGSDNGSNSSAGSRLHSMLPRKLQKACDEYPYLADYLNCIPIDEIGVPDYYPALSRRLKDLEEPNLIYAAQEGLFVHIYPERASERDLYIPIEPHTTVNLDGIVPEVERRLLDWTEKIGAAETAEAQQEKLLEAIDHIVSTNGGKGKIKVTPREMEALKYIFVRDKIGFGLLSPLLLDPYIEDISCSGVGHIFIEHKIFNSLEAAIVFSSEDELDEFVIWMGEWIKKPVTVRNPIVDATLPDGSRINIVYGSDVSRRGSNFTIRKFAGTPPSVMNLIEWGTMDYMMAAYLSFVLEAGMNLFVVGATASGKTTTMNAITTFIPPDKKIVSIEDTPELQVPHKNWIREVTRGTGKDQKGSEVGMFDLLKAALRQRPDRIIVGEIRGEEGAIAFQAMQTGHGVMSTFHASSVGRLIQRLSGEPINIPKTYVDNLEVVIIQAAVKAPGSLGLVRRITSINEIVGYDPVDQAFSFIQAFRWNPANDTFEFPGYMNSYLLEEKIAIKRGIPPFKRKVIYTELKRRAKIFQRLHQERKVRDFYEVFSVFAEAHRQGLL
ncbi:TPA: secretion system protein E [Candidatus Poribacteria bacterium]|nr:secretion system protein E [Candidatus Poribacteria bacterium]HEX29556.1 secretion system protein E [Candidatus Poribacteria bacterium]